MPRYIFFCLIIGSYTTIFATMPIELSVGSSQSTARQFAASSYWAIPPKDKDATKTMHSTQLNIAVTEASIADEEAIDAVSDDGAVNLYHDAHACLAASPNKAFALFTRAAQKGNLDAQHDLAVCYLKGIGIGQNFEQAEYWLKRAADGGNLQARIDLGAYYFHNKQYVQTFKNIELAASLGSDVAQYILGRLYEKSCGVDANAAMAVKCFKLAAQKNHAGAQYRLGLHYLSGEGVNGGPDQGRAEILLQQAAGQGYEPAKLVLTKLLIEETLLSKTNQATTAGQAKANPSEVVPKLAFERLLPHAGPTTHRGTKDQSSTQLKISPGAFK